MRRYFEYESESRLGMGRTWIEFDGEYATRQVERYGERWFSSRQDHHPEIGLGLYDQRLSELELTPDDEITPESFEARWAEAASACL